MINVAVVGYGNIGKSVVKAVLLADDMKLCGIIRRTPSPIPSIDVPVATDIEHLTEKIDVVILCAPSRSIPDTAGKYLSKGISTVDSFDIHTQIKDVRAKLDKLAKDGNAVSVTAAGWDPGSDSCIRVLMQAMIPTGVTYTNFGPGMSMGHSVAVKAIDGVVDAISMTIPLGTGIHRRMVYVQLEKGAEFTRVENAVKNDPYFVHDETHVIQVDDINEVKNAGHGVDLQRLGMSSGVNNQRMSFNMTIDNPALTAQIMTGCARAASRLKSGCYTIIEIPPVDLLPGEREYWVSKLV